MAPKKANSRQKELQPAKPAQKKQLGKNKPKASDDEGDDEKLTAELIESFGGDAADLELLKGIDSDDENAVPQKAAPKDKQRPPSEKELKKDISKMIANLGFDKVDPSSFAEFPKDNEYGAGKDRQGAVPQKQEQKKPKATKKEAEPQPKPSEAQKAKPKAKAETKPLDNSPAKEIQHQKTALSSKISDKSAKTSPKNEVGKTKQPSQKITTQAPPSKKITSTNVPAPQKSVLSGPIPPNTGQFMLKSGAWYDAIRAFKDHTAEEVDHEQVQELKNRATSVYEEKLKEYEIKKSTRESSHSRWLQTVMRSGTTTDKLGALTLSIQENPFFNLKALGQLIGMAQKKSRREAEQAIMTLKEIFTLNLLPDRKLKFFRTQPLLSSHTTDDHLLAWIFEEAVKEYYAQFIQILEKGTHDTMEFFRSKMVHIILDLLTDKPEQEKTLLAILVNKLGDNERKIASKIPYLLQLLLTKHPNMKVVVIKEVEQLMFRKNIGQHGQYYGLIFLNQIVLSRSDTEVAKELISTYFSIFKSLVKTRDFENKMLAAILTGVNRALPYSKINAEGLSEHIDSIFQIAHSNNFNIAIQALALLFQIAVSDSNYEMRYYRSLYETLLRKDLTTSSKQGLLLNLLYRSIKFDPNMGRKKAMLKRLLQVSAHLPTTFACSSLYLASEVVRLTPGISIMITQPEEIDGAEIFHDADKVDDDNKSLVSEGTPQVIGYNPYKRDPQFAKADTSCLWELNLLASHTHPTISKWAHFLLEGESIKFDGDPLQDFQFMKFLDKFSYKKPKKVESDHGGSIMQYVRTARDRVPVGSDEFKTMEESEVPEDELFFFNYFREKSKRNAGGSTKGKSDEDDLGYEDEDAVGGDENEDGDEDASIGQTENDENADEDVAQRDDESEEDGDSFGQFDDDGDEDEDAENAGFDEDDLEQLLGEDDLDDNIDFNAALMDEISDDEDLFPEKKKGKKRKGKGLLDETPDFNTSSTFASAEEFAHLLEESQDGHDNDPNDRHPRRVKSKTQGKPASAENRSEKGKRQAPTKGKARKGPPKKRPYRK